MMKNLTLALGVMIMASPAFATTPRLNALGEDTNGSYYIQDVRNIFLNPAQIVHYKKKLVLEFNPVAAGAGSLSPQGLFTNTFGDFTYGLSLNNNSARATTAISSANTAVGTANLLLPPNRTLEGFFAGGDSSLGWGLSVFYSGNGDRGVSPVSAVSAAGDERTSHLFGARAGVEAGNLQVFTTVGITSDSKVLSTLQPELKGKISVDVGATYTMDNTTAFAKFTTFGSDLKTTATTIEARNQAYGLGLGHKWEASKTLNLFGRIEADYTKSTTTGAPDVKQWNVPVVLAAEAQALNWLALRGSVSQSIVGQTIGSVTNANFRQNLGSTVLGAGAGLTFGEVQIDATLMAAAAGVIGADNLLSNVAMTYNF